MRRPILTIAVLLIVSTGVPALAAASAASPLRPEIDRTCEVLDPVDARGGYEADLVGTALMPTAKGEVDFKFDREETRIKIDVDDLSRPTVLGREYLTYVAWNVAPDGTTNWLGELGLRNDDDDDARLRVIRPREPVGIIVTAEPYYAVPYPSDTIVLRSAPKSKAARELQALEAPCRMIPRGYYAFGRTQEELALLLDVAPKAPNSLAQARHVVEIAGLADAETFAPEHLARARGELLTARDMLARGKENDAEAQARLAVESAEIARRTAVGRSEDARRARAEVDAAWDRVAELERKVDEVATRADNEKQRRRDVEKELELAKARLEAVSRTDVSTARADAGVTEGVLAELALERSRLTAERARLEAAREEVAAGAVRKPAAEPTRTTEDKELWDQLIQARLDAGLARLDAEVAQRRAELEIEMVQRKAELDAERARLDAERRFLEVERRSPLEPTTEKAPTELAAKETRVTPTAPVPAAPETAPTVAEVAPVGEEPAAVAEPELAAQRAALEDQTRRLEQRIAAIEASLIEREAAIAERERRLESARSAAPEGGEAGAAPGATFGEEAPAQQLEPPTQKPSATAAPSWWPFGRQQAPAAEPESVVETSRGLTAAESARIEAEQGALARERRDIDAEQTELRALRSRVEAERVALERTRLGLPPVTVAPAPVVETRTITDAAERQSLADQREELRTREEALDAERLALERQKLEAEFAAKERALEADRARLEAEKAELEAEPSAPLPPPKERDPVDIARLLESERARERLRSSFGATETERGLLIRLADGFVPGAASLPPQTREELARIAGTLLAMHDVALDVEGHTDSTGDAAANLRLSERRAAAVRDYLVEQGVPAAAISIRAYGEEHPVAPNDTAAGRRQNRRVELVVRPAHETTSTSGARLTGTEGPSQGGSS